MNEDQEKQVTVHAGLGAKISTRQYENQEIYIGVSGIPVNASQEFIDSQLEKATITLHTVVESLAKEMARRLREDYGR